MQDFVLNSHPVMVAGDPKSFLELLRPTRRAGSGGRSISSPHPKADPAWLRRSREPHVPPRYPLLEHDAVPIADQAVR